MKSFPSLTSVYVTRKHPRSAERKKATFPPPHLTPGIWFGTGWSRTSRGVFPIPAAFELSDSRRDPNNAASFARYSGTLTGSPKVLILHSKTLYSLRWAWNEPEPLESSKIFGSALWTCQRYQRGSLNVSLTRSPLLSLSTLDILRVKAW